MVTATLALWPERPAIGGTFVERGAGQEAGEAGTLQ